jgi:hypothetical protein
MTGISFGRVKSRDAFAAGYKDSRRPRKEFTAFEAGQVPMNLIERHGD